MSILVLCLIATVLVAASCRDLISLFSVMPCLLLCGWLLPFVGTLFAVILHVHFA